MLMIEAQMSYLNNEIIKKLRKQFSREFCPYLQLVRII